MTFMVAAFAHYHDHGDTMPRRGNSEPGDAPTGSYRVAGRDDWIAIAVRTGWRGQYNPSRRLNERGDRKHHGLAQAIPG